MATTAAQTLTKCLRCGRTLTSARSTAAGYGRTCKARIVASAKAATAKPEQLAKAVDAIETGAVVPLRRRHARVFRSVSSDGSRFYLTAATGQCNCPAGLKSRPCYHAVAAQLLAA